jgi:glycosyltransferase involved in cell wall biosynthesis
MKVAICIPTLKKPYQATLDSVRDSLSLLDEAGIEHCMVSEIGNPYISAARSFMLRKALDAKCDTIVFIDHDVSWMPRDLLSLLEVDGDVVAGTYRFKKDEEEYMGVPLRGIDGRPVVFEDKTISGLCVPAGFLKVTAKAVNRFIEKFPELLYGDRHTPHIDLFNHGAFNHTWYGEDYAFSRRWRECGGVIKIVPWLLIDHHTSDKVYRGDYHSYLCRQVGGSNHEGVIDETQTDKE